MADGTISTLPVAIIRLDTPYFVGRVEAVCMTKPVYDVLLGNIKGAKNPGEPNSNWLSSKSPEESQTQVQTDRLKLGEQNISESKLELQNPKLKQINAVQTRSQKQAERKPLKMLKVPDGLPEIDKNEIQSAQAKDLTLNRIRELAEKGDKRINRYGTNRFCIDFRKINKITTFDAEPIPNQEEIFAKLAKDHYFTKFDLSKGYW